MKKILIICSLFIITIGNSVFGITSEFAEFISIANIPEKSKNGYYINEDIYNKYNIISYGRPEDVVNTQRWKNVKNGKWKNASGAVGEYRVLGFDKDGGLVNNEKFPDDAVSGVSPESWNYIYINDASSSWLKAEEYRSPAQINYMLDEPLTRNGQTYNITARMIGTNKARLESFATWKSSGSIYTRKQNPNGSIWDATFIVPPMAKDADVKANLIFPKESYSFEKGKDILEIPFTFGAEAINLNNFTLASDIKNLSSNVSVQFTDFDKVSATGKTQISKNGIIKISKNQFVNTDTIEVVVRNVAVLETFFANETPMIDIEETTIYISNAGENVTISVRDVNRKVSGDVARPNIGTIKLYKETVNGDDPLMISKSTRNRFICAGEILVVKVPISNDPTSVDFYIQGDSSIQTLDKLTKKFLYDEPRQRNEKVKFSLSSLQSMYSLPLDMTQRNGYYEITYVVPYSTKQSLNSWQTLRNKSKNAMEINKSELFTKLTDPYVIKIIARNEGGTVTKSINLDVFERWDTIYNRDISEYVQ